MPVYTLGNKRPRIHPSAWVHPDAVLIGDVWLDAEVSIWPNVVMRADNGPIKIGARTSVQDGSVIHTQDVHITTVGEGCVIGHLVHLEGCTIESSVLVGSNAVVLENVICRSGSLIGASSVVTAGMEIPSGALAVGVPAKLKLNAVDPERIKLNADYYIQHLIEHRDTMQLVDIESCRTSNVFDV